MNNNKSFLKKMRPAIMLFAGILLSLNIACAQGYLQIVTPSCTQYTNPPTCSIPCTCDWATDASIDPCGTLSFNSVEVGLTSIKAVRIRNSNGSPAPSNLNVEISLQADPSGNFIDNWEIVDDADVTPIGGGKFTVNTIAPGAQVDIEIKFKPKLGVSLAAGARPAQLLLTSSNSDLCYIDANPSNNSPGNKLDVLVGLTGFAVKTPLNFAMVLDRSGSMSQIVTGTTKRIDLLKTASKYFVDLLAARNNTNDKLSIVRFDNVATPVLLPLAAVNASTTRTLIDTSPELNPGTTTGIGNGLETANTSLGAAPAGGKNVTMLFTDGEENVGPPWMAGANTANSAQVFTIGMGNLVTSPFQVALSNYATTKNGGYYYVPDGTTYSSAALPVDLQKAFLGVFTDASGMQGIVDPIYNVTLGVNEKIVSSAWITSSDRYVLFTIFDQQQQRRAYNVEIRSPKGTPITNGSFLPGIEGTITEGDGYFIYKVDFSKATSDSLYAGKWDLVLIPKKSDIKEKNVTIGFAASTFSDLKLNVGLGSTSFAPGSELRLALDFTDADVPVNGIRELIVKLTTPSGKEVLLKPTQDPFDKWITNYPHTYEAGTYQIFVRATIANSKGQITTREQTRYLAFGYPPPTPAAEPCISCLWIKVLFILTLFLLLAILVILFRKKKL